MPNEPRIAEEASKARRVFIDELIANPEKFRRECDEVARGECPWMTQAQLDASWDQLAEQMGL